jgi:hypothetical protein
MIIFGTLTATSLQPDLLAASEKDLASHMVLEHTVFFLGAISVQVAETVLRLIVSFENTKKRKSRSHIGAQERKSNLTLKIISVWSQSLRKIFIVNSRYGFIWLIISIILLTFWQLPSIFDYATLNEQVHIIQHI